MVILIKRLLKEGVFLYFCVFKLRYLQTQVYFLKNQFNK
jgi:hypothetical protein